VSGVRRRAEISLSAIVSNVQSLREGTDAETVADLRGDAYGHGLVPVAAELIAQGVSEFLVSPEVGADSGRGRIDRSLPEVSIHLSEDAAIESGSLIGPALFGRLVDTGRTSAVGDGYKDKAVKKEI